MADQQYERGLKLRTEMFGKEAVDKRMNAFGEFGKPLQHIIIRLWRCLEPRRAAGRDKIARHDRHDGGGRPRQRAARTP